MPAGGKSMLVTFYQMPVPKLSLDLKFVLGSIFFTQPRGLGRDDGKFLSYSVGKC